MTIKSRLTGTHKRRRLYQVISTIAANSHLRGFMDGTVYGGPLKKVCVPFLNCYSCPGAVASCPLGALQGMAAAGRLSLYVLGGLVTFGALLGRWICGWLCPFGLLQEVLYGRTRVRLAFPAMLRNAKYAVLVMMLPLAAWWTDASGVGLPYFCAYLCPAGTLQAGIPLLIANPSLRELAGALLSWKLAALATVLAACVVFYRPFCRGLCPLGALYGLCNRVSLWRLHLDGTGCTACARCDEVCPVNLEVSRQLNHPECIRCLRCVGACPGGALRWGLDGTRRQDSSSEGRCQ